LAGVIDVDDMAEGTTDGSMDSDGDTMEGIIDGSMYSDGTMADIIEDSLDVCSSSPFPRLLLSRSTNAGVATTPVAVPM
jgi:hypothetical protein